MKESPENYSGAARLEREIVAGLVTHLESRGFKPILVDDGGESFEPASTVEQVLEIVFGVDVATLIVENSAGKRRGIVLVCGEGETIITDYTDPRDTSDGFAKAMGDYLDHRDDPKRYPLKA